MARIEQRGDGRTTAGGRRASHGPLLLALAGVAAGALVWWARARRGARTDVERPVLAPEPRASETEAARAADLALAERYDRYAG